VPVVAGDQETQHAVAVAANLAGEGGTLRLLSVLEVPPTLPLDAQLPEGEREARNALARAQALADARDVHATTELTRARDAGAAVVDAAECAHAEAIVVAARMSGFRRGPAVDRTTRTILRHAGARVVVLRGPHAA
jgi:nucleotide-binding universal stress UspA family protein